MTYTTSVFGRKSFANLNSIDPTLLTLTRAPVYLRIPFWYNWDVVEYGCLLVERPGPADGVRLGVVILRD